MRNPLTLLVRVDPTTAGGPPQPVPLMASRIRIAVEQLRRWRLDANHLASRLPPGTHSRAAFAGLQDTTPRAALMALHARIEGVKPDGWEHPSLVQTWAPRGAVYVVASDDLWVFALGIRPRDAAVVKAGRSDRLSVAASGVPIRWDTRTTVLLPRRELSGDPEGARLELARRYLRSLGPGDAMRFQRFAAVGRADAENTFAALAPELIEVEVEGHGSAFVLATDVEALITAPGVEGARLLPNGADPVLQPIESWLFGARPTGGHLELLGIDLPAWCVGGIMLLDGETVGSFGRRGGTFVLVALKKIGKLGRRDLEAEAWSAPIPGGVSRVVWRQVK